MSHPLLLASFLIDPKSSKRSSAPRKKVAPYKPSIALDPQAKGRDTGVMTRQEFETRKAATSFLPALIPPYQSPHEESYIRRHVAAEELAAEEIKSDPNRLRDFAKRQRQTNPAAMTEAEKMMRAQIRAQEKFVGSGNDTPDQRARLQELYREARKFNDDPLYRASKADIARIQGLVDLNANPLAPMQRMMETGIDAADFYSEYKMLRARGAGARDKAKVATVDGQAIHYGDAARQLAKAWGITQGDLYRMMDGRMGDYYRRLFNFTAQQITKSMSNQSGLTEKDLLLKEEGGLNDGVSSFSVAMQDRAIRANPDLARISDLEAGWRHIRDGFNNPITILSQAVDGTLRDGHYRTDDELSPWEKAVRFLGDQSAQIAATHGMGSVVGKAAQTTNLLRNMKGVQAGLKAIQAGSNFLDKGGKVGKLAKFGINQMISNLPDSLTDARIDSNTTQKSLLAALGDQLKGQARSLADLSYLTDSRLDWADKLKRAHGQVSMARSLAGHFKNPRTGERMTNDLIREIGARLPEKLRDVFEKSSRVLTVEENHPQQGPSPKPRPDHFEEERIPFRPDATPEVKEEAHRQVRYLGGKVTHFFNAVKRDFQANMSSPFIGKQIQTIQDLVDAGHHVRDPRFETMHLVYTDKDGNVLLTEAVSNRLIGSSVAFKLGGVKRVRKQVSKLGATSVYAVHNHPSGNPTPSKADSKVTGALMEVPEFKAHMVVNTGHFRVMTPEGYRNHKPNDEDDNYKGEVHSVKTENLLVSAAEVPDAITSVHDMSQKLGKKTMMKIVENIKDKENRAVLFGLDQLGRLRSVALMDADLLTPQKSLLLTGASNRVSRQSGSQKNVLVLQKSLNDLSREEFAHYENAVRGNYIFDVVGADGTRLSKVAEISTRANRTLGRRMGTHSLHQRTTDAEGTVTHQRRNNRAVPTTFPGSTSSVRS